LKIHEYQAKALLAQYGIPVPRGKVASTPVEAREIAAEIGSKVGGIRMVNSPTEAEKAASQLIGTRLVTHQTGSEGCR